MARPLKKDLPAAWLAAIAVALATFGFRFLTQGALENDHYVILARAHQLLAGDWPLRDFEDPGMPGAYLLSAAAARLFAPTLVTEVVLCIALLAIAAALTWRLAARASGSAVVALAAVAVQVGLQPRLYSATKVLVPVAAIAMAWRYAATRSRRDLVWLALGTAAAFLVRHDFAVYIGVAVLAMIAAASSAAESRRGRAAGLYIAVTAAALLPWLAYVEATIGVGPYFASALHFAAAEATRTTSTWPAFLPGTILNSTAFYVAIALPLIALLISSAEDERVPRPGIVFAAVMTLLLELAFLRGDLSTRLPDVGGAVVIVAAWLAGRWLPALRLGRAGVVVLVAVGLIAVAGLAARGHHVPSPGSVVRRSAIVLQQLRNPVSSTSPPAVVASVRYLSVCTSPASRVLVEGFGPDIPVLARRLFAGGVPDWLPGYYESPAEVQRAIDRLDREHPAAAIMLEGSDAFARSWPAAAGWLARNGYSRVHAAPIDAAADIWVRHPDPGRADPATGVPCPGRP